MTGRIHTYLTFPTSFSLSPPLSPSLPSSLSHTQIQSSISSSGWIPQVPSSTGRERRTGTDRSRHSCSRSTLAPANSSSKTPPTPLTSSTSMSSGFRLTAEFWTSWPTTKAPTRGGSEDSEKSYKDHRRNQRGIWGAKFPMGGHWGLNLDPRRGVR